MSEILLEICANSLNSALAAEAGGADRVELCENISSGGTTPAFGTLSLAKKLLSIPIHVLIRPRPGDFLYNEAEFACMKMDINACKEMEIDSVVIGILKSDGSIDSERCKELIEIARPMSVTFHRAFDLCIDPYAALEEIIALGCDRLLSSGQETKVTRGALLLHQLNKQAAGRIVIMPGSGVNEENIKLILDATLSNEIHMSAGQWMPGLMNFRHPRTHLSDSADDDYRVYQTSAEKVRAIKTILNNYNSRIH